MSKIAELAACAYEDAVQRGNPNEDPWEAAANAIIEECAKSAEGWSVGAQMIADDNKSCPLTRGHFEALADQARMIGNSIRFLKMSGSSLTKTEDPASDEVEFAKVGAIND